MSQIGYAAAVSSYALAELAAAAELSARTVRFYQATGLLQRPERAGRQVVYTDSHLDRLRQILAPLRARLVPDPPTRLAFLDHPRLRRSSLGSNRECTGATASASSAR